MSDPALDLDQNFRAPLAPLNGERSPAPAWFEQALAEAPERSFTPVEGAEIETLTWGERCRPGLLLLHGGRANADWWPHIAPMLAGDHRVAAMSLSGNGRSGWRERYTVDQYAREMVGVARAAGLYEAGAPIFVAHSFGSRPLLNAAADPKLAPRAAVVVDSAVSAPDAPDFRPPPSHPSPVYPSLAAALARFRLMPPQLCENLYILDNIARQSLMRSPLIDGSVGWTWRFDPFILEKLIGAERPDTDAAIRAARCPLAFIHGDRSAIVRVKNLAYTRSIAPAGTVFEVVKDAAHHLFLDQPLAFVERLRAVLAGFG